MTDHSKYQSLFQNMELGATFHSQDGTILEANQAAERILGIPAVKSKRLLQLIANYF